MNFLNKTLIRKLAVVLVLKLIVLMTLWWFFVREQQVKVDGNRVAAQFLQSAPHPAQGVSQ